MGKGPPPKPPKKPSRPPERTESRGDRSRGRTGAAAQGSDERSVEFLPPLRPRPKLLLILGVVFVLWLVFLLVLRFKTVTRHGEEKQPDHESPASTQPVRGAAPAK